MKAFIGTSMGVLFVVLVYLISSMHTNARKLSLSYEREILSYDKQSRQMVADFSRYLIELHHIPQTDVLKVGGLVRSVINGTYQQDGALALYKFLVEKSGDQNKDVYYSIQKELPNFLKEYAVKTKRRLSLCSEYSKFLGKDKVAHSMGFPNIELDSNKSKEPCGNLEASTSIVDLQSFYFKFDLKSQEGG